MESVGRILVALGAILLLAGLVIIYGGRWLHLGRLPGDIIWQKGNFTFYFPVVSSLLLSLVLTFLLWLMGRVK